MLQPFPGRTLRASLRTQRQTTLRAPLRASLGALFTLLLCSACSRYPGDQPAVRLTNDVGEVFEVLPTAVAVEASQADFVQPAAARLHVSHDVAQYYVQQWIPLDILANLRWLAAITPVQRLIAATRMQDHDFLRLCQKPLADLLELKLSRTVRINTDTLCYEAFLSGAGNIDDFFEVIRFRAVKTDLNRKKQPTRYKTALCIESLLADHDWPDSAQQVDAIVKQQFNDVQLAFLDAASASGVAEGAALADWLPNGNSWTDDRLRAKVCRTFSRFSYH